MAKGQDQTLQIALIIFAVLFVMCAGFTYYFYRGWTDSETNVTRLNGELQNEKGRALTLQTENETYRQYMGFGQFDNADAVKTQFDADMARYAGTFGEADKKYRRILEIMFTENQKFAQDQAADKQKIKEQEDALLQITAEKEKQIAQYQGQLKQLEQDAAAERAKFNEQRTQLEAQQQQLAQTLEQQRDKLDQERNQLNERVSTLEGEITGQQRTIDKQKELIAQQDPSFEVPDGEIKWVNQANSTVWINLGDADSVRRQVTFAVVDTSAPDVGSAEPKGSIEVTRILDDHMAEARVTSDDPRNPILPGDKIFSQVWHRGQQLHFAFTGKVDMNDDGRSDLDQARDLVKLNGGVVDAYAQPDGKIEGAMSVETRYLVLGDFPEATNDAELRKAWDDMSKEASSKGIATISLVDFMNQMGYKSDDRTVSLGSGARSQDFRPRPNAAASEMRPRSPYELP